MLDKVVQNVIEPGIGMGFQDYILICSLLGFLIFYALDVRVGLLITFVGLSTLYIAFQGLGWSTANLIILVLASVVLLSLSLFMSYQKTRVGYA
jgi:hypothetical protein